MIDTDILCRFTLTDIFLTPFFFVAILLVANSIKEKYIREFPYFKYFIPGLIVKLIGAFSFCIVYCYYYRGGDTIFYYYSAKVFAKLFIYHPGVFFQMVFSGDVNTETLSFFDSRTGWPSPWLCESPNFFPVRILTFFVLPSLGSYVVASLLIACFSYVGVWKLYTVFEKEFPFLSYEIAIAVLFIPSFFFWGSGIGKDSIALASLGWFLYSIFEILHKRKVLPNIISLLINGYVIDKVKPYLLYVLIISIAILLITFYVKKIKISILKILFFPFLLIVFAGTSWFFLLKIGSDRKRFELDTILIQASYASKDQKQESYNGSSFDIGDFEPTVAGALSKIHLAINAALFRPYIWEAKRPMLILSGIENFILLCATFYLLLKLGVITFFRLLFKHPLLLFSFTFSIVYSFSIGLAVSNFGTLARLKIPLLPFYVAMLFILNWYYEQENPKPMYVVK